MRRSGSRVLIFAHGWQVPRLAAILRATGGYAGKTTPRGVPLDEVLRIGDAATQTNVLSDLYAVMKGTPTAPDLALLWDRLGIRGELESLEFDPQAPLAAIRGAMMVSPKGPL